MYVGRSRAAEGGCWRGGIGGNKLAWGSEVGVDAELGGRHWWYNEMTVRVGQRL